MESPPKSENKSKLERIVNAGGKVLTAAKTFNSFGPASKLTSLAPSRSTIAGIGLSIKGKTEWLIRFDKPHPSTGPSGVNPHININPKITGSPDPHVQISSTTLNGVGKAQTILTTVNYMALTLALGVDTYRLCGSLYKDKGISQNTKITSASIAGSWTGATAGGYVGGTTGALIGSLFGPIGTAVGALTCGYIAGVGGAVYGERGAKNLVRNIISNSKDQNDDCDYNCDEIKKEY